MHKLGPMTLTMLLLMAAASAHAGVPDSLDISCDVDRTAFRSAAVGQTSVTFRVWDAVTGGSQCGADQVVSMANLVVSKAKTDKFDAQRSRKFAQIRAVLGTDGDSGTAIALCAGNESWLDIQIGATTLTCDFSADPNSKQGTPPDAPARRRINAVGFAQQSGIVDIGAGVHNYDATLVSVPDISLLAVPFTAEDWDTAALHDNTDPTKLVAPVAGRYLVTAAVGFLPNPTGIREVILHVNGIQPRGYGQQIHDASTPATAESMMATSAIIPLSAGDYVQVWVAQSSGGPLDLYPSSQAQMQKIN